MAKKKEKDAQKILSSVRQVRHAVMDEKDPSSAEHKLYTAACTPAPELGSKDAYEILCRRFGTGKEANEPSLSCGGNFRKYLLEMMTRRCVSPTFHKLFEVLDLLLRHYPSNPHNYETGGKQDLQEIEKEVGRRKVQIYVVELARYCAAQLVAEIKVFDEARQMLDLIMWCGKIPSAYGDNRPSKDFTGWFWEKTRAECLEKGFSLMTTRQELGQWLPYITQMPDHPIHDTVITKLWESLKPGVPTAP